MACSTRSPAACASCRRSTLNELPRMADFAEWGEAIGRGLGWGAGAFLAAYNDNRKARPIRCSKTRRWQPSCSPSRRKGSIGPARPKSFMRWSQAASASQLGAGWPKDHSRFGAELRRIAPQLRVHGIAVDFVRTREARLVTLNARGRHQEPFAIQCNHCLKGFRS